jgi:hypothetical protein
MWNDTSSRPESAFSRATLPVTTGWSALLQAGSVKIDPEQVHAIGAGKVVEHVPVEIRDGHAFGGGREGAAAQVIADVPGILERHPIEPGELEVRQAVAHRCGLGPGLGEARAEQVGEPRESRLTAQGYGLVRIVGAEEGVLGIGVVRDQPRDAPRHSPMAGERGVLRPGQLQALRRPRQGEERNGSGGGQGGDEGGHRPAAYRRRFTA